MRRDVLSNALLDKLVGLVLAIEVRAKEAFHRKGFYNQMYQDRTSNIKDTQHTAMLGVFL